MSEQAIVTGALLVLIIVVAIAAVILLGPQLAELINMPTGVIR